MSLTSSGSESKSKSVSISIIKIIYSFLWKEITPKLSIPFAFELSQNIVAGMSLDFCVKLFINLIMFSCKVSDDDELEQCIRALET